MGFRSRLLRALFAVALIVLFASAVSAETFTFVHLSDIHISGAPRPSDNLAAVVSEINAMALKPAFVVVTGDETETGFPTQMERYKDAISKLSMPVYNVPGNHETKWSNLGKLSFRGYFKQEPYYSFNYGSVHFVGLDSSVWCQHHGLLDRSQLTWLKNDLAQAGPRTPSVLYYHHCPGFIPNEPELLKAIAPYNVRLILVGHGHSFKTWKRNGLLFQEDKGTMNDTGGYRILEVSDSEIKSYTKLVATAKVLDATIPLAPVSNKVTLIRPRQGELVDGRMHIRAMAQIAEGSRAEYAIDGAYQPVTLNSDGVCDISITCDGTPGRHTVTVRVTDPDGMEWTDSAQVRINGNNRETWRFEASGGVQRAVTAFGDRLYFGALGGDVYCLDARTGDQIWRFRAGADVVSGVAVDNGLAFFGATDGRIIALDAKAGKLRWEYETGGPILGAPVTGGGKIFIGSSEAAFYALDAQTGKLAWKFPMERMTQVIPLYMNGTVYFGAWDKIFYALYANTGAVRWKTPIGISFYFSTASSDPSTDGKSIKANVTPYKPEDPDIWCLDAAGGQVIWKLHNPGKSDCGFNSTCAAGDKLYTPSGSGEVFCLQTGDGKLINRLPLDLTAVGGRPVVADNKVYLAALRGEVACGDTVTGKKLWSYSTGGGYIFTGATVWQNLLIVPSTDGSITALYR